MTGGVTFERKISMGTVLSAVIQIIVFVAFIAALNFRVGAAEVAISNLQSWEKDTNETVSSVETRLTTVEVNQKNGADRGMQTQAALRDLQQQVSLVLQQQAAGNAKLEAISDAVKAKTP